MAHILLHTSSMPATTQSQALRLQQELQFMGHHVEFSTKTHPLRLLKNNYDVFHLLTDKNHLSLLDIPLLILAKLNHMSTVVSGYGTYSIMQDWPSTYIDALSTTTIQTLKANKAIKKNKFILPVFPTEIKTQPIKKNKNIYRLKVLNDGFDELLLTTPPIFVDASRLTLTRGTSPVRKKWRSFQRKHPLFKDSILILHPDNTLELFKTHALMLDLSSIDQPFYFQSLVDAALAHEQFIILNKDQASGYPDFWKHGQNSWINDLHLAHSKTLDEIRTAAQAFYKKPAATSMKISIENKMNELSRVYSKIINEKVLTYNHDKVHPA